MLFVSHGKNKTDPLLGFILLTEKGQTGEMSHLWKSKPTDEEEQNDEHESVMQPKADRVTQQNVMSYEAILESIKGDKNYQEDKSDERGK